MSTQVFGRVSIEGIHAVALSRNGGLSLAPFDSLNLASYVGDDQEHVSANLAIAAGLVFAQNICVMSAEHGNAVHVVASQGVAPLGDGLITKSTGLALAALSADCVPFGLIDPIARVIAVGHAGWRGVLTNVMQSLLDEFESVGANLKHTHAVIGPAICADCYEVPGERVDEFRELRPEAIASPRHLDLVAGVRSIIDSQVIQVHELGGCTLENPDLFSYRRAGGNPTGRGGLVLAIAD
jgi:polyphenol oxidase